MRTRWSRSELNKWCCSMLSSMFIYPARMHTVYTQIPTNHLSWSEPKPVPTDDRWIWINSTLWFRSSINLLQPQYHCRTYVGDQATPYSTILHSWYFWWDHVPHGFILQSDWFLKILRGNGRQKVHGNATRPLSRFWNRAWKLGYLIQLSLMSPDFPKKKKTLPLNTIGTQNQQQNK